MKSGSSCHTTFHPRPKASYRTFVAVVPLSVGRHRHKSKATFSPSQTQIDRKGKFADIRNLFGSWGRVQPQTISESVATKSANQTLSNRKGSRKIMQPNRSFAHLATFSRQPRKSTLKLTFINIFRSRKDYFAFGRSQGGRGHSMRKRGEQIFPLDPIFLIDSMLIF